MAKKAGKTEKVEKVDALRKPGKAPAGFSERTGTAGSFWNPVPGDVLLQGTIAGRKEIPNKDGEKRERVLVLTRTGLRILPDHYDLMDKLEGVLEGTRVHVEYLGKEVVKGVASPMARYHVETGPAGSGDVPF